MKQQSNPSTEGLNSDKPRWDNWHIRLPNPKDQQKIIDLFRRSGAKTKSDFVRARLLGEEFKVISVDKQLLNTTESCRNSRHNYIRLVSSITKPYARSTPIIPLRQHR